MVGSWLSPGIDRHRRSRSVTALTAVVTGVGVTMLIAPQAAADPAASLQDAVIAARSASSCAPLRYDSAVEQAADIVNGSTDDYISHTARNAPADSAPQPLPILKDLGSDATKAVSLQAATDNDGDTIKGVLLEGFDAIPDCSYTDFGVSLRRNVEAGYVLAVAILAGR